MAPPSYSDLGKAARDLFSKGYSKFVSLFPLPPPPPLFLHRSLKKYIIEIAVYLKNVDAFHYDQSQINL